MSQFYDASCEQTYEVQSAGLTADEYSLAEQMFCSDDVRTPFESVPDDGDFDALRQVLITDSTSEIADDPEKPCQVNFTGYRVIRLLRSGYSAAGAAVKRQLRCEKWVIGNSFGGRSAFWRYAKCDF